MFATAAATGRGDPECVEVMEPGGYSSMISVRPITAASGSELEMPFPHAIRSGLDPVVLEREPLSRSGPKPACTSSMIRSAPFCRHHASRLLRVLHREEVRPDALEALRHHGAHLLGADALPARVSRKSSKRVSGFL